ncbi:MCE family protein [Amycolatopsis anabasis]|uniref:MCE family protein n=1 Tax=Amycolatopsis anabasis TaxID=1840409 RepID=UPI00131B93BF|nr:MCE family protein [Amycolatopsis anabasis]
MTHALEDLGARARRRTLFRLLALGVVAALLVTAAWSIFTGGGDKKITAYFAAAVGIYPASDVRVLGVTVGTVDAVEPQPERVKVTMTVDGDVELPAEASAIVVTPSLVADRYVQLTPVYSGGEQLADGAEIPQARTATPVEVDQLMSSLNDLATALGPNGANADGAVTELLNQGAKTLDGNGKPMGEAIKQLGEFARTLSGSKDQLFGTVDNISKFTSMLAANDDQVNQASQQLTSITKVLADQRQEFSGALNELTQALGTVQGFIRDNRDKVKSNVDKLAGIAKILADQKGSLSEAMDTAPNALTSLLGAYNPQSKTLDGRGNLLEYYPKPGGGSAAATVSVCGMNDKLDVAALPAALINDCASVKPRSDGLVAQPESAADSLPVMPLPTVGAVYSSAPKEGGH